MQPKPDGKWRFCIDFRALNDCCTIGRWPLANIQQIFRRLGARNSKFFGVMDLTSGFHQTPLESTVRPLTAFITPGGLECPWVLKARLLTSRRL